MKLKLILLVVLVVIPFSVSSQSAIIKLKSETFWIPPSGSQPDRLVDVVTQETHLFIGWSGYVPYWFTFVVEYGKISGHSEPPINPFPPDPKPQ